MDIYSVNLRGTHVDLIIMVFFMLYLITAFDIMFNSEHRFCSNSVTLLPYNEWKYIYFFSETLPPPTHLCAQGCKGSGRKSLRYNLSAAKEDREEKGLGGREKERGEGVT